MPAIPPRQQVPYWGTYTDGVVSKTGWVITPILAGHDQSAEFVKASLHFRQNFWPKAHPTSITIDFYVFGDAFDEYAGSSSIPRIRIVTPLYDPLADPGDMSLGEVNYISNPDLTSPGLQSVTIPLTYQTHQGLWDDVGSVHHYEMNNIMSSIFLDMGYSTGLSPRVAVITGISFAGMDTDVRSPTYNYAGGGDGTVWNLDSLNAGFRIIPLYATNDNGTITAEFTPTVGFEFQDTCTGMYCSMDQRARIMVKGAWLSKWPYINLGQTPKYVTVTYSFPQAISAYGPQPKVDCYNVVGEFLGTINLDDTLAPDVQDTVIVPLYYDTDSPSYAETLPRYPKYPATILNEIRVFGGYDASDNLAAFKIHNISIYNNEEDGLSEITGPWITSTVTSGPGVTIEKVYHEPEVPGDFLFTYEADKGIASITLDPDKNPPQWSTDLTGAYKFDIVERYGAGFEGTVVKGDSLIEVTPTTTAGVFTGYLQYNVKDVKTQPTCEVKTNANIWV